MRTINTCQDVEELRRSDVAPTALVQHIAEFFQQLDAELVDNEVDPLHLDKHWPIILLEVGDDMHSLNLAGLCNESDVPYHRAVEFVEKLNLGEVQAYRLAVLLDNDFVVTFFTLAGTHNEEVEQWLSEQAQRG